jgi:hypothetical protein
MKCLVFLPKDGIIRITQFATGHVEAASAIARPAITENDLDCGGLSDLDRRCTAPFRLSAALRSRLPGSHCVYYSSGNMLER